MALPLMLNRSDLPGNILRAIDEILDFLPDSLWTGICITTNGLSCAAKTGDTPSPSPAPDEEPSDTPAMIKRKRKAANSAKRNANANIIKRKAKKAKHEISTPEEIGTALRRAQDSTPAQQSEPQGTCLDLFIRAINAPAKDAIWEHHMFGKKLRFDENNYPDKPRMGRMRAVAEKFLAESPHINKKHIEDYVKYARRVYDITARLTPNQVRLVRGLTVWSLIRTAQKNVHIPLKMCRE
jgi:hypothetical protein